LYDSGGPRLNRTSVGLKLSVLEKAFAISFLPQSNQRGIETMERNIVINQRGSPQSNQRGIETRKARKQADTPMGPQSNQRGIETLPTVLCGRGRRIASIEPAWD